ncbi:ComGF family competence protein [Evansella sp. AB-P1]|uniref:ComGF family competence protein n=1 Tax=Evansella sp. AB-P1 TaxID=3037653 RepID=UPI00241C7C1F|nr:ComGF family competence protein [Evansella sp. AB-P1]MDG5788722.1 ComGF family competence protein [Evansella sp. AB-P1]
MIGVYQIRKGKSYGITLVELLISLSIFFVIISMVPIVFSIWVKPESSGLVYEEKILFMNQLKLDFRSSDYFWTNVNETILYFNRPSDQATIQYELYQDKVRRRVNKSGHEVFLQNVSKLEVRAVHNGVEVKIQGIDGLNYEKLIIHPRYAFISNDDE